MLLSDKEKIEMLLIVFLQKGCYVKPIDDLADYTIIDIIKDLLGSNNFVIKFNGAFEAKVDTYYEIYRRDGDESQIGEFFISDGSVFLDYNDLKFF